MAHVVSLVGEQVPMSVTSALPAGSVTKPWTAVRVVQLAAAGALGPLGLDTPVHAVVDPWLARQVPPAPSLSTIWAGHAQINDVTVRQVASMAAGFRDYDDFALQCVHSHELECIGMAPPIHCFFKPFWYFDVL
jgi:CubicO group peptidase (beta-lactamase class C family)